MILNLKKEVNNLKIETLKVIKENLPYYFPNLKFKKISKKFIIYELKDKKKKIDKKKILFFIKKIISNYSSIKYKTIYINKKNIKTKTENTYRYLLKNNEINQNDKGKFIYRKNFKTLFFLLDNFIKKKAIQIGACEEIFPSTLKKSTLIKSKYLRSFPQHAYFVAPTKIDHRVLKKLNNSEFKSENFLEKHDQNLCPSACYPFFEANENKKIDKQIVTAIVNCHRYELADVQNLTRLRSYWVREIIFYDNLIDIETNLSEFMKWINKILTKWDINFEIKTANDPFFLETGKKIAQFQSAKNLKHELLLNCKNKKIAVGSFNNHLHHLTSSFNFISDKKIPFSSACIGFGIDRFSYALLSQLGNNIYKWPKKISRDLKIT